MNLVHADIRPDFGLEVVHSLHRVWALGGTDGAGSVGGHRNSSRCTNPRSTDRRPVEAPSDLIGRATRRTTASGARSSASGTRRSRLREVHSVVSAVLRSSAVRRPRGWSYTGTGGRARRRSRARLNALAHGHSSGVRSVGRARATDEAAGDGQEPGAHGAGHGELVLGGDLSEHGGPADEVMGERRAQKPRRVGEELPRGHVLEARTLLQVADGQLDGGMGAVEGVDVDSFTLRGRSRRRSAATGATAWPGVRPAGCGAR